ncbi:MAG TPA: TetR/AcrR family transcriptional regulator [Candidatus Dormibacteraeota bacterium]|nr:TetR/AcrR family transcriptional regulator [Candidatus Dormibacteraeota bacterium]
MNVHSGSLGTGIAGVKPAADERLSPADARALVVRERILDGAARAFAVTGYQGTTVPAIAAEARVSVGLLYRYFAGKAELFLALCERGLDTELEALAQTLGQIADPRERLERATRAAVEAPELGGASGLFLAALAEADRNPRLRQVLLRRVTLIRELTGRLLREAAARGELPLDLPLEPLVRAIPMLFDGAIVAAATEGPGLDLEAVVGAITGLLGEALGWRGASATPGPQAAVGSPAAAKAAPRSQ